MVSSRIFILSLCIFELEDGVFAYLGVPDGVEHFVLGHGKPVLPITHLA